jgi:hypothetical protein
MNTYSLSPLVEIIEDQEGNYAIQHTTGFVLELSNDLLNFIKYIKEPRNEDELICFIKEQSTEEDDTPEEILTYLTGILKEYSLI